MKIPTKDAANGKWYNILMQMGIDSKYLVNKHGSCPICEGKDRFRWDNKNGTGSYYCNQCGAGDGLDLLMRYTNSPFSEVAKKVDLIVGNVQYDPKDVQRKPIDKKTMLKRFKEIWINATDDWVFKKYFKQRGIELDDNDMPTDIRGVAELTYVDDDDVRTFLPAMVAVIRDENGLPITIHRTYPKTKDGRKKKIMAPIKNYSGHCVQLYEPMDGILGVAEGIETALAARICTGIPTWAAITSNGLTKFSPPPGVHTLFIFGDSDASFTGQAAAYTLANRLKCRPKENLTIHVVIPEKIGYDMLDVLNETAPYFKQVVDKFTGE